ncbi:Piso0_004988 [Millerozyma farinosa CBS 7064]|uniref:NADPH-dependent diflavin oxidoreductase 1 n=1 Tax=Pichia sorbitophila (strain ATCC MYA-4447 / BCRC 22081 / CBS 7064 / NBRC 10061 / NRRL Y-12695) TaxID=559304 RepID=G8Y0Z0_PICSO|nr:Piso0_004988 [Millerozyma farinosa CBS 7064]
MPAQIGLTILYGSETGNAQDYAELLNRRLKYYGISSTLTSLNNYPLKNLITKTKYLIIVCSTTGQGELPRNAKKFMRFILKKKLPDDLFNHIKLTTFGLGDSSYPKFNYAIKKIHARLLQLGCGYLCERAEADEQSPEGSDGYYTSWESALINGLKKDNPKLPFIYDDTQLLPAECTVKVATDREDILTREFSKGISCTRASMENSDVRVGKIYSNKRITSTDHFQDVRHLIIQSDSLSFSPGDTVGLYPSNDERDVDLLFESQPHWIPYADKPLSIEGNIPEFEGGVLDSKYMTLRSLFTHHIDIMSIPRRAFFMQIYHFVDSSTEDGQREKDRLKEFSNIDESEELYNYANRPRRSILEVISEFQNNLRIPMERILEVFPVIKPRLFSIASRPDKNMVELVIAVVEYKTILRRVRRGLCTKWIKSLNVNDKIIFSLHKSNLVFESEATQDPPIIMISPGTGVAPMKALIEDSIDHNKTKGLYLFYGCRLKDKDFLFSEFFTRLSEEDKLHFFPCFSREPDCKTKYVQHKLFSERELIGELILNQSAIVYVCGSNGSMPREVRLTIIDIIVRQGGLNESQANAYLSSMENNNRYIQETW